MNLSAPFIRRPVMTTLVTVAIVIVGVLSYPVLPVSDLPNVDTPVIDVSASLPGANPETVASSIATPLEKEFSTISGLESMSSSSSLGRVQITLQFTLDRDIDDAAQDVQSCISRTLRSLPSDMPSPPSFRKVNPSADPIVYLALTSHSIPMSDIDRMAQSSIVPKISMLPGVAQVNIYGSQKYAVRVRLDPRRLAAWKIGIDEVQDAIKAANVNLPGGSLDGRERSFTIDPKGQLLRAPDYRRIIVATRDGHPVRLQDVGEAVDSVENDKMAAWHCNKDRQLRAIVLAVQKQPGSNTVKVADSVMDLIPELQASLPHSVELGLLYDRSATIRKSVDEVKFTMLLTIALVVLVIFLFLRNVRATIIPSLSLPLSLLGTFTVMYLLGYSLDNLSLMALTLALGFVVDDAIVILENIFRHYEMGKTPFQAALDGSSEISFTIVSMTLSLSAVFIPVLFMGGTVGRLFREFAVTIGVSVLVSGFVALSLIPMLASLFINTKAAKGAMEEEEIASSGIWGLFLRMYGATLRWNVRNTWLTFIVSIAVIVFMGWLFEEMPKGFLPDEDQSRIRISTDAEQGVGFEAFKDRQDKLVEIVRQVPEVESFMSRCGGGGGSSNSGGMFLSLVKRGDRKRSAGEIVSDIRAKLSQTPGIRAFPQMPPPIQIGARGGKAQYQYTLVGTDTDALYKFAEAAEKAMLEMPELVDVSSDLQIKSPQVEIEIDRDQASKHGISAEKLQNALYSSYGSRQISSIYAPEDQYKVMLELAPESRSSPDTLSHLYVRAPSGSLVPLDTLVRRSLGAGPLSVNHTGQIPSVTISFNLKPGVSLGQAVSLIDARLKAMPPGVTGSFQGVAQAFQKSMEGMGLLLLTIAVIYIVLGILYESFIHPLTILTALPFAGAGALLSLWLFGFDLSLYAFIGLIMLVGIVKKNGIMMVDFAIEARRGGMSAEDAIVKASLVRFRPIMMTTLTTLMAGIPLATGLGIGSEARQPLGISVVGGVIFSQMLTLYATPVFYVWMERLQEIVNRRRAPRAEEA